MLSFAEMPRDEELPAIDDHLLANGVRYELYDGRLVPVPPAEEPHAECHIRVGTLLASYAHGDFTVASDMLTRVSETSEVAPDVSVYPRARDPLTGGRLITHLAFEVVATETLSHAGRKAGKLVARGVRRVFAIDVEHQEVLEWSPPREDWIKLELDAHIDDPALATPLPIGPLLTSAALDDDVARALLARRNLVIAAALEEERTKGRGEGREEGAQAARAASLINVLTERSIALDSAARARILAERDLGRLDRWIVRAISCTTVAEVFEVA